MARVLVVEDDPDIRDLISMRLVLVGHRVIGMPDATMALDTIDVMGAPDAYVLDVGLPDIDGFELLGRLRAVAESVTPAVFVSAWGQDSYIRRGQELGAAYLTKPFAAHMLIEAVDGALTGRRAKAPATHPW